MSENSDHTTAPIASLDSDDMACSTFPCLVGLYQD
jgi:hypothetical protein